MLLKVHQTTALALAVLLLAGGCAPRSGAVSAPEAAPAAPALACREIEGLEPLLVPGSGLLLGEIHGTAESPAFVANAACLALRAGLPVTVALEMPREAAQLDSPFWKDEYQDGRRSQAMAELLGEVWRLQQEERPIQVAWIDRLERPVKPAERDRWMAEALAQALDSTPKGVVIALTGNLHSRVQRGTPWNADSENAGFVLTQLRPDRRVTALDVSYPDGTAWTCTSAEASSCQERPLRGRGDGQGERVVLHPEVTNGHHGVYHLRSLTASPPAVRGGPG